MQNPEIVRIKTKLNRYLVSASEVLSLSKVVVEGYMKRPTNSARTSSRSRSPLLTAGSQCNLLMGGDQIVYASTRRGIQIAPSDSATSGGSSAKYSLLLQRFPLGNKEYVATRGVIDGILDGSKRRSKSIQKNQKLLEASLLVVAKFL